MRTSTVLDRTLPPSVLLPGTRSHDVLLLHAGIPYTTLLDTGSNKSCIDAALAAELQLSIQAMPGTVQLAHAGVSAARMGKTAPLSVTALFPVPSMKMPAVELVHEFEVLPLDTEQVSVHTGHRSDPSAVSRLDPVWFHRSRTDTRHCHGAASHRRV